MAAQFPLLVAQVHWVRSLASASELASDPPFVRCGLYLTATLAPLIDFVEVGHEVKDCRFTSWQTGFTCGSARLDASMQHMYEENAYVQHAFHISQKSKPLPTGPGKGSACICIWVF